MDLKFDLTIKKENHNKIPTRPGIYVLYDKDNQVLYVGKSNSLRNRVKQHFYGHNNSRTNVYANKYESVSLIFCDELTLLDELETRVIQRLRPLLNIDKVNYEIHKKIEVDYTPLDGSFKNIKCAFEDVVYGQCKSAAKDTGYCFMHDPINIYYPWVWKGKLITSEMQRLLHGSDFSHKSLYFYMSKYTFGKLLFEKTFAEIDFINNETVLKFKKHHIVVDNNDVIRLERYKINITG